MHVAHSGRICSSPIIAAPCSGTSSARSSTTTATSACAGGWPSQPCGTRARRCGCGSTIRRRWPGWRRTGCKGVEVVPWTAMPRDGLPPARAPDVLIEAFGCDPRPSLSPLRANVHAGGARRAWINLEYLSAEPYVERCHGLPSPVFRGPGAGLVKHFFYPGFTPAHRRAAARARPARAPGRASTAPPGCAQQGIAWRRRATGQPVLLRAGAAAQRCWRGSKRRRSPRSCWSPPAAPRRPSQRAAGTGPACSAHAAPWPSTWLPHLPQTDFDHLLWACDLNFVRGEDSLVRALWAGKPFVWQIYPQDDDAHHAKLGAFLDWLDAPSSLRALPPRLERHGGRRTAVLWTTRRWHWGSAAAAGRASLARAGRSSDAAAALRRPKS